ncbi:hypothetical protein Bca52824_005595 [Brassica carinata]|uniref:Uncharacterized protein n=1 Tax=Brassica carinata TaxID=52824 RepID=A0A8X7WS54_BRACI|nr:hypothetical protein Bca52824_005595 [Brassica carinata]
MSGDDDDEPSYGSGDEVNITDGHRKRIPAAAAATPSSAASGLTRKRSRKACGDAIVEAMLEIAAASKMRAAALANNGDRFSISKCIRALDDLQGVDQQTYFVALDLFENPSSREIFISLKYEKRLKWLQGSVELCSYIVLAESFFRLHVLGTCDEMITLIFFICLYMKMYHW